MSLLIKALQKAEQSKDAAADIAGQHPGSKEVELDLAPDVAAEGRFDLGLEGGFGESGKAAAKTGERAKQQQAASTVFAAKQGAGEDGGSGSSRALWVGVGGLVFLLLAGGGFYYYLDSLQRPQMVVARPAPIVPPPAPVAGSEAASASGTGQKASSVQAVSSPVATVEPPAERPAGGEVQTPPKNSPALATITAAEPAPVARKETAPAEEVPVKVTRNRTPTMSVNSNVMAAYEAYSAGDDVGAERLYRQALQSEPRNIDALLGLAATSVRQNNADQATASYLRVLELEPRNAAAQTGLISLTAQADPLASESRLKTMLAQQPDAAFLHAALGSLYAEQNQWPQAQQSYFQATRYEPGNAEYAFNLAVSLDQMGKGKLALEHYQRALELLPKQRASVLDRAGIEARIAQLRSAAD
jgi:tetratricopeptide (TPR) repeat protein